MDIYSRLNSVFQEVFDNDNIEIFDETTAKDIEGWDSLKHITLMMAIEKEFGIRFKAEELGQLSNISDIITILGKSEQKGTICG